MEINDLHEHQTSIKDLWKQKGNWAVFYECYYSATYLSELVYMDMDYGQLSIVWTIVHAWTIIHRNVNLGQSMDNLWTIVHELTLLWTI